MIFHLKSEVFKRSHYNGIIVFKSLLYCFSICFDLSDTIMNLLKDIQFLVAVINYAFKGIDFVMIFVSLFNNSIEEVLVLMDFVDNWLA